MDELGRVTAKPERSQGGGRVEHVEVQAREKRGGAHALGAGKRAREGEVIHDELSPAARDAELVAKTARSGVLEARVIASMIERNRARDERNEAEHIRARENSQPHHLGDGLEKRREAALLFVRGGPHHLEDLAVGLLHDEARGVRAGKEPFAKLVAVKGAEEVEEVRVPLPPAVNAVLDRHVTVADCGRELPSKVAAALEDEGPRSPLARALAPR